VEPPSADLGFYGGGCPIPLRGALKVERRRGCGLGRAPSPENFCIISKWCFYAFPEILIDTVTAIMICFDF